MHILHITAGLPPSSGVAEVVAMLAIRQTVLGNAVTIAAVKGALADRVRQAIDMGVTVTTYGSSHGYFSLAMLFRLGKLVRSADVVHVHSNWTFPVWWGCWCARRSGKPLVMSPHGCLDPVRLRHSAWKKRMVGSVDRYFLKHANVIHATSASEAEWVREALDLPATAVGRTDRRKEDAKLQVKQAQRVMPRIEVIPNGVDIEEDTARKNFQRDDDPIRNVLYLGRLHPLKGLDLLLEAWAKVMNEVSNSPGGTLVEAVAEPQCWRLVLAGPDEQGTLAALERQAQGLGLNLVTREMGEVGLSLSAAPAQEMLGLVLDHTIVYLGPRYGEDKRRVLQEADLFVLPSRSENFGLVVAEALAAGVPVITTQATPWPVVTGDSAGNGRCGWWVEADVESLAAAFREAMVLGDDARRAMGAHGRKLVREKYRWEVVVERMDEMYREVSGEW